MRFFLMFLCVPLLCVQPALGAEAAVVERQLAKLGGVRTLHVENLGGQDAGPIRDLLIASVQNEGLFVLTEDSEKADAFLRGSAEDLIYTETSRYREGLNARASTSSSRRESGESNYGSSSFGVSDTEDSTSRLRRHEAVAAVRIVLRDGEVVWSAAAESAGAKYHGAAADVAAKLAAQLAKAVERARAMPPDR